MAEHKTLDPAEITVVPAGAPLTDAEFTICNPDPYDRCVTLCNPDPYDRCV
ncbi:MAG: hypothetical protein JWO67_1178 [Streptosporangiaceae bacterium]|jgi:hypothetical protein|nr:hypothetical protein [Streptosporangiaceae bacterium]